MSYELHVMASMTILDAVYADGVAVGCVARLAAVEVVHGEGGVAADLVEALPTGDCLFHLVLVVEDVVAAGNWLDTAGQAQPTELVLENLVVLQRGRGIVCDLHAGCLAVVYAIAPQDRMRLRRDEYPGLSVSENVIFLENALATVEDADAAIPAIVDLVPFQRWIRVGFDPHSRHGIVEDLVLFE